MLVFFFKKMERNLKKYDILTYKKLVFYYYPKLKEGNFVGKLISTNKINNIETYEIKLPTDSLFKKVHGDVKLYYKVDKNNQKIILEALESQSILKYEAHKELDIYKGIMISKEHPYRDIFKIDLINSLKK